MDRFFGMGYEDIMEVLLDECIEGFDPENANVFDSRVDSMVDAAQNGTIEMAPRVYSDGTADITAPIWAEDAGETDILVYPAGGEFNAVYWMDYERYCENPERWVVYDESMVKAAQAHIRRERLEACTVRTGTGKYRVKGAKA